MKNLFKRLLLRLILGRRDFQYMCRTLSRPGLRTAHMVDVIIRSDGRDRRFEADWLKRLSEITEGYTEPPLRESVRQKMLADTAATDTATIRLLPESETFPGKKR